MHTDNYLITIAIPTYKRPKYLKQAIDSAINQIGHNLSYNIIVVNNDPESDMSDIIKYYKNSPVTIDFYTNEQNLGMLGNVNRCVELSSGKWIGFLHDDDLLLPNYIKEISQFLNLNDTACIIPRRYLLFENNKRNNIEKKRWIKNLLIKLFPCRYLNIKKLYPINVEDNIYTWQNCYGAPSCGALFNKNKIEECNLFFPEGTLSWDFLSFFALNQRYNIYILDEILSVYRMTTGASLRPEVQLDFFNNFQKLKERFMNDRKKYSDFVAYYNEELSFLNTMILGNEAKDLAIEQGFLIYTRRPSVFRYLCLMYNRLSYLSNNHLDVEVPLDEYGKRILKKMLVLD